MDEEDDELAPIQLVRNLNQKRDEVKKIIPKLKEQDFLNIREIKKKSPFFIERPKLLFQNYTDVGIQFGMDICGDIHVTVEEVSQSKWYLSTNHTLFAYENMKIQNLVDSNLQFYPYGYQNSLGESIDFKELDYSPYFAKVDTGRRLSSLYYSKLTAVPRFPTSEQVLSGQNFQNQNSTQHLNVSQSNF